MDIFVAEYNFILREQQDAKWLCFFGSFVCWCCKVFTQLKHSFLGNFTRLKLSFHCHVLLHKQSEIGCYR